MVYIFKEKLCNISQNIRLILLFSGQEEKESQFGKSVLDSFLTLEFFLPREIFWGNNCGKNVLKQLKKGL